MFRPDNLAAKGRIDPLATTVPNIVRTIDVIKSGNSCIQAVVLMEMPTHPFRKKFLPTITLQRHGRVGMLFSKHHDILSLLIRRAINTRTTCKKIAIHARFACRPQQVRIDQHGHHAAGLVPLKKPHPAHIGGQVVDLRDTVTSFPTRPVIS
jgi:hypothetical protein